MVRGRDEASGPAAETDPGTGASGPTRGSIVAAGLAVAAVVLVVLVTTSGNVPLATEGSGGWHLDRRGTQPELPASEGRFAAGDPPAGSHLPGEGVLAVLAQTLVVVVGVTAMVLIGRALLRLSRREPEPIDLLPIEHWPEPVVEMSEAVEESLHALAGGPVDEVVIACWVRLEEAAAAAGVGRGAAETSAEMASRVLADLHAPPSAVDDLLRRYRQARYSHHPLGEADRAAAVRALEDIRLAIAGARA